MFFLKKLIFLSKSKASLSAIFIFLKTKLFNIFIKKNIIKEKRKHGLLLKNKKINNDYFSAHAYNFLFYLSKFKSNFDYLEIGSYEGNSSIFVANSFKDSNITCVDNWTSTEEYIDHIDFSIIEKNFDDNTKFYKNINKIKKSSDEFFLINKKIFDIIYLDGHHLGSQVFRDCNNAWKFLKKDGYLICDDYIWQFYKNISDNPCYAINKFLKNIEGFFEIKKISNSQIFIKKII
jgi:predicted O-methyltransferase YrrM